MDNYFIIGEIVNTQGIKGELRVVPTTDDITRFELLKEVYIVSKTETIVLEIEKVWYLKNFVILKFKNLNNINDVEKFKKSLIKIPESLALPLEENEFYIRDLIDLEVFTAEDEFLGILKEVIPTNGANDVYLIKKENSKDLLIPAIKECILKVDIQNKKMIIKIMEGLR